MKKADAKEALEIYRKFPPIGDRVKTFLQVAKVRILSQRDLVDKLIVVTIVLQ